jgi:hypothetical protein
MSNRSTRRAELACYRQESARGRGLLTYLVDARDPLRDAPLLQRAADWWCAQLPVMTPPRGCLLCHAVLTVLEDFDLPDKPLLKKTLKKVRAAPLIAAEKKARAHESIEQLAQPGRITVGHDGRVELPMTNIRAGVSNVQLVENARAGLAFTVVEDAAGLIAYLCKPMLIAAADALIDPEDSSEALSSEARSQKELELLAELIDAERLECSAVWKGQAEGLPNCEHRADVDPRTAGGDCYGSATAPAWKLS